MNIIIGFACAVGVDMGFNTQHHDEEQTITTPMHVQSGGHKHKHNSKDNKHHHNNKNSNEKDGCCNDVVLKFQNVEKNIVAKIIIDAPHSVAIFSTFPSCNLFNINCGYPQKKLLRFFYPPPLDLLILIQKFQV